MATPLYLTGIIEWAHHLFVPDEYNGIKKWKVTFYPDEDSLAKLKAAGSKKQLKLGNLGKYTTLTREVEREFRRGEGPKALTPPEVLQADGTAWPEGKAIGNGSKATVKLEIYNAGSFGKGTRLQAVRIDELVEYERPDEAPAPEREAMPF